MSKMKAKMMNESEKSVLGRIESLQKRVKKGDLSLNDSVEIVCEREFDDEIYQIALNLKPWRKGPFRINELFIDSEWQSFVKFNLLKPHLNELCGKVVADVGCNNGYYLFKMLEFAPKSLLALTQACGLFCSFALSTPLLKQV